MAKQTDGTITLGVEHVTLMVNFFDPKVGDMKRNWPELAKHEEFESLSSREMHMVWLLCNPLSPLVKNKDISLKDRCKQAIEQVFEEVYVASKPDLQAMHEGKIVQKYEKAITKMSTFNLSHRLRAYFLARMQYDAIEQKMIEDTMAISGNSHTETEKQEILKTMKSMKDMLPNLLTQIEGGLGVAIKEEVDLGGEGRYKILAKLSDL